jgi:hypothetical protein
VVRKRSVPTGERATQHWGVALRENLTEGEQEVNL